MPDPTGPTDDDAGPAARTTRAEPDGPVVRAGLAAVAEWEREHGALTDEELTAARRVLGT